MLARDIKIRNVYLQRKYLERLLTTIRQDGDPSVTYVGTLFPENQRWLMAEGFKCIRVKLGEEKLSHLPAWYITVNDMPDLSPEEAEISENFANEILHILEENENKISISSEDDKLFMN